MPTFLQDRRDRRQQEDDLRCVVCPNIDPNNAGEFNNYFRNPVLAQYPAESIYITCTQKGENGVKTMIEKPADSGLLPKPGKQ